MNIFKDHAVQPACFLLPNDATDLSKWAVVACDQFTSQPEYWEQAGQTAGDAPSTLHMVYPEAWLGQGDGRIGSINRHMLDYARSVLTKPVEGFILIERETSDGLRIGLLGAVDLEQYDFSPASRSAVRPTEDTVTERVPPRVKVRREAVLETGHVLLLADDPMQTLVEPLYAARESMPLLYDFPLMLGGGRIRGWHVRQEWYPAILSAFEGLRSRGGGLDFAVGDGNHSLATARTCWQELRQTLSEQERLCHPARFAMAEINNLHSPAMVFHPIHRALFGDCAGLMEELEKWLRMGGMDIVPCAREEADLRLNGVSYRLVDPAVPLPVGVLQPFLDEWLLAHPDVKIDYIHGDDVLGQLEEQGATGLWVPAMDKAGLFPSVRVGPLPRKTFSMGEAPDKRYYLEARRIR
ncbi:MAG: DUF1015 domain-containing protein [Eubacteriales bacterium]|nr:DUF1015 domain-containing protein [Eubacteriales bacterium]